MMKITGEVYQVGGSGLTAANDAAVYLFRFGDRAALVDAGTGDKCLLLFRNIQDCGVPLDAVEYLLITHCHYDHTGGVKALKEETGCQAVAHEKDAVFLENGDDQVTAATWYGATLDPVAIDITLKGMMGELFLGPRPIKWFHIPGHSPGSVVYCIESEGSKVLFGQDVHGPLDVSLLSDQRAYENSLNMLIALEADILCEGHYGVLKGKGEVKRFIRSFL